MNFLRKYGLNFLVWIIVPIALIRILLYFIPLNMDDTNVTSAFWGAVLGGAFSYLGVATTLNWEVKAKNSARRKEWVYFPVYNELKSNQNILAEENVLPKEVYYKPMPKQNINYPTHCEWEQIKNDARYLDTPKLLISKMNNLYEKINTYLEIRKDINAPISEVIITIVQEETQQNYPGVIGLGDAIVKNLFNSEDKHLLCEKYIMPNTDKVDSVETINNRVFYECNALPIVQNLYKAREDWVRLQSEIITYLGKEIVKHNKTYPD